MISEMVVKIQVLGATKERPLNKVVLEKYYDVNDTLGNDDAGCSDRPRGISTHEPLHG